MEYTFNYPFKQSMNRALIKCKVNSNTFMFIQLKYCIQEFIQIQKIGILKT